MTALKKAQSQVTSGKRSRRRRTIRRAAMQVMKHRQLARARSSSIRTNVQRASSRISVEDTSLQQLQRSAHAREGARASQQAIGHRRSPTRAPLANAEVQQLFTQVDLDRQHAVRQRIHLRRRRSRKPRRSPRAAAGATLNYTSTNPTGSRRSRSATARRSPSSLDGTQLLAQLRRARRDAEALSAALDPASTTYGQAGISAALTQLDAAFNAVQSLVGDVGARGNQLDTTSQNLDAFKANLTTFKSDLQDVDCRNGRD